MSMAMRSFLQLGQLVKPVVVPEEVTARHHCDEPHPDFGMDMLLIRPGGGQGGHRPTTTTGQVSQKAPLVRASEAMSHNRRSRPATTLPANLRSASSDTHSGASVVADWGRSSPGYGERISD